MRHSHYPPREVWQEALIALSEERDRMPPETEGEEALAWLGSVDFGGRLEGLTDDH